MPLWRGSRGRRSLVPAAHLTCVGATQEEVDDGRAALLGGRRAPYRRAARRPAAGSRPTSRIRAAIIMPPTWSPD